MKFRLGDIPHHEIGTGSAAVLSSDTASDQGASFHFGTHLPGSTLPAPDDALKWRAPQLADDSPMAGEYQSHHHGTDRCRRRSHTGTSEYTPRCVAAKAVVCDGSDVAGRPADRSLVRWSGSHKSGVLTTIGEFSSF